MEPPKILVIDDEEISRVSCERILRRLGVKVRLVGTGREGLDILMREPQDLVLVDLKMPEMDGMEVTRRIRELDPDIVTIIITGYATIESAVTVMKEGAYDYLPKPFTPDELLIVVRRGLENGGWIRNRNHFAKRRKPWSAISSPWFLISCAPRYRRSTNTLKCCSPRSPVT